MPKANGDLCRRPNRVWATITLTAIQWQVCFKGYVKGSRAVHILKRGKPQVSILPHISVLPCDALLIPHFRVLYGGMWSTGNPSGTR